MSETTIEKINRLRIESAVYELNHAITELREAYHDAVNEGCHHEAEMIASDMAELDIDI